MADFVSENVKKPLDQRIDNVKRDLMDYIDMKIEESSSQILEKFAQMIQNKKGFLSKIANRRK